MVWSWSVCCRSCATACLLVYILFYRPLFSYRDYHYSLFWKTLYLVLRSYSFCSFWRNMEINFRNEIMFAEFHSLISDLTNYALQPAYYQYHSLPPPLCMWRSFLNGAVTLRGVEALLPGVVLYKRCRLQYFKSRLPSSTTYSIAPKTHACYIVGYEGRSLAVKETRQTLFAACSIQLQTRQTTIYGASQ
jgi:hypothetical protein